MTVIEVGFLEVVTRTDRIKMEKEKVKEVLDWLTSKRVKNVQKFLELPNNYRQFIKNFITIVRLSYNLVKKKQKLDWMDRQKKTFEKLKKRFTRTSTGLRLKNKNRSRYTRLYNRRSIINGV